MKEASAGPAQAPSVSQYTRGRRCLWRPAVVTTEDIAAADALDSQYGSDDRTACRIRRQFGDFARINELGLCAAVKAFIGQATRVGLRASTLNTYLGYLAPILRHCPEYHRWAKIIALAHADADSRTAPDCTLSHLRKLVAKSQKHDRCLLWVMLSTGARVADLARLRRKQIQVTEAGELQIQFRIMKNRRRRRFRVTLAVPLSWAGVPGPDTLAEIANGDPEQRLFGSHTANVVNSILARLSTTKVTTYSFRRRYINSLFDLFEEEEKVKKYTLHLDIETVKAFYVKWEKKRSENEGS